MFPSFHVFFFWGALVDPPRRPFFELRLVPLA